jgi:osmotically-inducible protein OsmY
MGTDANIEAAVQKELASDPLIDANGIVVEVTDGGVSLTGTVPSQAQRAEATSAARRVAGVTRVDTLLAVAMPSDDYGDDSGLVELVNQSLAANAGVPKGVKATVRQGNVFLTGTVRRSAQRAAAEETAVGVAGVLSVTNEIDVLSDLSAGLIKVNKARAA